MPKKSSTILAATVALAGWASNPAQAAPTKASAHSEVQAQQQHLLPQSMILERKEALERLESLARHKGAVGVAARNALVIIRKHFKDEADYIFPALTLLPDIAAGKVTPDMAWALPMIDKVKANQEQIFEEHVRMTEAMTALMNAADKAHDHLAHEFAESVLVDVLNDREIQLPTVLLIGEYLHAKLPTKQ